MIARSLVLVLLALLLHPRGSFAEDTVRVQLRWYDQAQFAGFYVAQAKGFYDRERVVVELMEGGPGINTIDELAAGRADVAVGWLPQAEAARARGVDVVNVAQIFARPGMAIICRRGPDLRTPTEIAGKSIGVWNTGDELDVREWLAVQGIPDSEVTLVQQRPDGIDLIEGKLPCVTAMTYNEYWRILAAGISPGSLLVTRLSDEGTGFLEDGLYVMASTLEDPAKRDVLARFLRATLQGWSYARGHVDETLAITMAVTPTADAAHQRRMLESILRLLGDGKTIGLLDLANYERSMSIILRDDGSPTPDADDSDGWTHRLWYAAGSGNDSTFRLSIATRHYLEQSVAREWFYALDLIGTLAFGIAGFMRARRRRYDLWGAFILTMLPAVGGGTLRDLLVGGDRHPPFIFKDPTYIYIVLAIVVLGTIVSRFAPDDTSEGQAFGRTLSFFDTVGMAAFTVIGAKVALLADLNWIWVPFCAALTCAGGGMLLDIVTGREPRTFQGEPYEEIAVIGGLFLCGGLLIADRFEHSAWIVTASIVATMVLVFTLRTLVIARGWRSYRLGPTRLEMN